MELSYAVSTIEKTLPHGRKQTSANPNAALCIALRLTPISSPANKAKQINPTFHTNNVG